MKFMLALVALGCVGLAWTKPSLPVNPGGIGGLFKGPNSETIIKGPDGSVITAAAEGGAVISNAEPIVVAEPVVPAGPIVVEPAPVIEAVAVPTTVADSKQSSDLIGPSGRIATQGSSSVIAGPASTTVSGPAVIADTVVRGAPIVGAPVLGVSSPVAVSLPIATVTAAPVLPLSTVTTASVSPISINANIDLSGLNPVGTSLSLAAPPVLPTSVATVTAAPPVALSTAVTSIGTPLSIAASPISTVTATASATPLVSTASASVVSGGTSQTVTATNSVSGIAAVTPTPQPLPVPGVVSEAAWGVRDVGPTPLPLPVPAGPWGVRDVGINDKIDLRPQLIPDQIAVDNRQLNLNQHLIPATNIIPPEIPVTPRIPVGRLRPTPGTILTTPGLSTVANSPNIQREEDAIVANVTPNILEGNPQLSLTPQQILQIQNQQTLLTNQVQSQQPTTLRVRPDTLNITPNQLIALEAQRNSLNNQIQSSQQAAGPEALTPIRQENVGSPRPLFTPNIQQQLSANQISALGNIPQDVLRSELARSGVDASQIQLANIPLSEVSALPPSNLNRGAINDGLSAEAWGRYGRDTENKAVPKKVDANN